MVAYVAPFAIFMLGLMLTQGIEGLARDSENLFLAKPAFWVYPLQTLACAAALLFFWRNYQFSPNGLPLAVGIGFVVFLIWISPQLLFGAAARVDGFNPGPLEQQPALYWGTIASRMLRLVVVVPLVEEIFWRGFLQRYLIDERFASVPFGKYTHLSFWGVTVGFMLVHLPVDWPAAFVTGAIYGWIAVRTKSLLACVIAHATTNLLLGIYILATEQWGFW